MSKIKLSAFALLIVITVFVLALPVSAKMTASPQTYTVMVGLEKPEKGITITAYFPENVTVHVGDTVHWVQNSNEVHTVTFLAGNSMPELLVPGYDISVSPLMFNPVAAFPTVPAGGQYDGTTYANSGIMGREPGQAQEFDLTFTKEGTFDYVCLVHGVAMSGTVNVVADGTAIPSPGQAMAEGRQQMAKDLSMVPAVVKEANAQIEPPQMNQDGTMTYHVEVGYNNGGQIDLTQFFPNRLTVRPGDTITWELSGNDTAPHTVTFLNGESEPSLTVFEGGYLYINSQVLFPSPIPPTDLTRSGIFNSGLLVPGAPQTTYTLVVGNMSPGLEPYLCQLHDTSGMKGTLVVVHGK